MQLVLFVFVFILQNTEYIVHLLNTNRSNLTNKESELIVSGILVQIVQIFSAISAIRGRISCRNTENIVHLLNTNLTNLTNKKSELIVSGILVQIVQKISAISAIRVR